MMSISAYLPMSELITLTLLLLFLHWLKRTIGILPLYIFLSLFFLVGQFFLLPDLSMLFMEDNKLNPLNFGLIFTPVIIMFLIIYEEDGTLEAQRFLFSQLMAAVGIIYLTMIIVAQYHVELSSETHEFIKLLLRSRRFQIPFMLMVCIHTFLLLLLPVGYQFLRNWHVPRGISIFIHLCFFLGVSYFIQRMMLHGRVPQVSYPLVMKWVTTIILLCAMAQIYVLFTGNENFEERKALGMLSTLLVHLQSASRMRQSVEEWAERYELVFDNSLEMIFLLNEKGAVMNANRSAVSVLGAKLHAPGYILHEIITDENNAAFDWSSAWNSLYASSPIAKKHIQFENMHMTTPSGKSIDIDFTLSSAKVHDKDIAIMLVSDTTRRHEAENERKRLEEQLMHSQRLEAVGVLAGGVAHDFNNLLHSIQSSAEILGQQPQNSTGTAMLQIIDNASKRAADLINKLLGFARKGKYQETLLDIAVVAKKASDLFDIGLKDINFRFLAEPEPMLVNGDETQLQQVILNLLLNAKDALKPGDKSTRKISIRIGRASDDMAAWAERPPNTVGNAESYVVIRIKDTGTGMSKETIAHIFEPFYSTKGKNGTGLGLSMVYGCVTHHKGWLNVQSRPDEGTDFYIFLPLAGNISAKWNIRK
ncbi:MAG: hypothetical protein IJS15_06510 [Victivallales bacterium]|nr:hypothetical protein [Victivallales bacterium]